MKKQFIRILFLALCSAVCVFCLSACSLFEGSSSSDHHHEYQTQEVQATCTDGGYTLFECACGDKFQINSNPLGHEFVTYNADNNATCETNGTETATCIHDNCQAQDTREMEDSALGHDFTDYVYQANASCEKDGTEIATCNRFECNKTNERSALNTAIGHDFTDYTYNNAIGAKTANCNRNNCKESDILSAFIFTKTTTEANTLTSILEEEGYQIDIIEVDATENLSNITQKLHTYEHIIFVNIANSDLPQNFDRTIQKYINKGGSLFTVGGNDENDEAHAYNRQDLYGTLYQEMLPVQAINYTPPVGVMLLIDNSGSMSVEDDTTGNTLLDQAKNGAIACLEALTERDYCGVISLSDETTEESPLSPMSQKSKIIQAIDNIELGGGTVFAPAIEKAGQALRSLTNVERRHIILVTDGMPADSFEEYGAIIKNNQEAAGITLSIVAINMSSTGSNDMKKAVELGNGRYYDVTNANTLPVLIREELNVPEIKEMVYETFTPKIHTDSSVVNGISQEDMPSLDGFYGTKLKENATMILSGNYGVPIYAEWDYGNGRVGSFMCDLNGAWSADFIQSETGRQVLIQMLKSLMRI